MIEDDTYTCPMCRANNAAITALCLLAQLMVNEGTEPEAVEQALEVLADTVIGATQQAMVGEVDLNHGIASQDSSGNQALN